MKKSTNINWKDVSVRAAKTFAQAFLASVSVEQLFTAGDLTAAAQMLNSMALAGLAAGVSAVWNLLTAWIVTKRGEKTDDEPETELPD